MKQKLKAEVESINKRKAYGIWPNGIRYQAVSIKRKGKNTSTKLKHRRKHEHKQEQPQKQQAQERYKNT